MIYIFIFIFTIIVLSKLEKLCWGTYITPLTCLMIPTGVIILIGIIASNVKTTYYPFYLPSLQVWIIGFLLIGIPSWIISWGTGIAEIKKFPPINYYFDYKYDRNNQIYRTLCIISTLIILVALIRMRALIGSASWGSDEFSENYSTGGLLSHFNVLLSTIFIYMFYRADKQHRFSWVICGLTLINMFAIGVKSWIIGPIIIGYLGRIVTKKSKLNVWVLIGGGVLMVLIFAMSYILLMVFTGKSEMGEEFLEFLADHFLGYLLGAPLSFSADYNNGIVEPYMPEALFAPLLNFFKIFSAGQYIMPINPSWVQFGESSVNVRTFIGTAYCYNNGGLGFVLVLLVYGFYFYFIQFFSSISKNPFLKLANCTNMGFLILGFFEFYWLNLAPFEIVILFLILSFIYKYTFTSTKCKCSLNINKY